MSAAKRLGFAIGLLFLISGLWTLPSAAQDGPRYEFFGGYSYWRFDSAPLAFRDRPSMNGGTVSAAFNITPNFGVVGQIGGGWSDLLKSYDAAIGPQLSYRRGRMTAFGQVLFGRAKTRLAIAGNVNGGESSASSLLSAGGGFDYRLTSHFSVRVAQFDYLRTKAFDISLGNMRVSTGIVYHFGLVKAHKPEKLPAP